jgi:hypothetical protein
MHGATRRLAVKMSRRAMIDRVGKQAIALSLGGAGLAIAAPDAWAHTSNVCGACTGNCCGADSVWCSTLTGTNACPSGTVGCGHWAAGSCSGGRTLYYADCCKNCDNGAACRCVGGHPHCCRHQAHRNGTSNDCGDHIYCRRSYCS